MNNSMAAAGSEIERYEGYIKLDPTNTLLWTSLADLYARAGRRDEAIACYEKCLILDPANAVAKSRLASTLIAQRRFAEAERMLLDLLKREPGDGALHHNLGVALYGQQRWDDALAAFRRADSAGLAEPVNLAYRVYSLHQADRLDEAMRAAHAWLERSPGPRTEGYVALLEMDHGDMQSARERAERVLSEQPDNADAAAVLGNFDLEEQAIDDAARHFERIVAADAGNPRGWLGLGLVRLYQQKHRDAIAALERVLKLSPGHAGTLVTLGWARLAGGDAVGAEAEFRKAVAANHNFGEAHGGLASALMMQGRCDEGEEAVKVALRLDRENFGALFAKSLSLTLRGKKELGQKLLAEVLQRPPQEGARPLIENIQIFMRRQGPRGNGTLPAGDDTER